MKCQLKKALINVDVIRWITILFLFLNCMFLSAILNINDYIYDSKYYWTIADSTLNNGRFDLSYYPETFRGAVLPLLILFFKTIFNGVLGWKVMSAIMVSILWGLFLPQILNFRINCILDGIKVVISEGIFLSFWGQFLQYPLSDLPACFSLREECFFWWKLSIIKKK